MYSKYGGIYTMALVKQKKNFKIHKKRKVKNTTTKD